MNTNSFWNLPLVLQAETLEKLRTLEIHLNQSRVQYFHDCHRKYWWQFEQYLIPDRPKWALDIGKATHTGLALMGSGKPVTEAVAVAVKELESLMPKRMLPGDLETLEEAKETVARLLVAYEAEWEGKKQWTPIAQETKGVVEVGPPGTKVYLVFRTDKLAIWNSLLWIVDHKTAGKLDLRDLAKYELNLQFSAYPYGISKLLKRPVAGVIIDILVKTKVPQFTRDIKVRSPEELQEFEDEFIEVSKEIAWRRLRVLNGENPKTVFYKNTNECLRFGECWYRPLCLQDNDTRRSLYLQRPLDYVDAAKLQLPVESKEVEKDS
jgi:hypothetical protein